MTLALITACFGSYDPLHKLPLGHGFDEALCVTDDPGSVPDGWTAVHVPGSGDPRLDAKVPKMEPWRFTDAELVVWLDASFQVTGDLAGWAQGQLAKRDFVVWQHPEGRICLGQEAEVCWQFPKYERFPVMEQARSYFDDGMPRYWGLFAAGMLGWRVTEGTREFGSRWLGEQSRWSPQDQVSLPYLLWDSGLPFGLWPANEYRNDFVQLRWDLRPDNAR
jgi:hypothetical protein